MSFEEQIKAQNAKLSKCKVRDCIGPVDKNRHKEKDLEEPPASDDLSSQLQMMLEARRKEFEKATTENDEEDDDDSDWSFD